jgi:aryl-phospho-beta-D-glucosidase BglC (GH1 family)
MKAGILLLSLTFTLLLAGCKKKNTPDPAAGPDQSSFASAPAINQRLGRGINLGDTCEASWAEKTADPADFQRIAASGFKHVRLPIRWEMATRSMYTAPYNIQPAFLLSVKKAVDAALKNKLHVIINMHHHDSLFTNPDGMKPMFLAQWKQIAAYFRQYSDSLLFEVLNEPHDQLDAAKWNVFFADALTEIRKTNPKRTVLLGLAEWGGVSALSKLVLPADTHIILTVHYYNPFMFTHQGAEWVSGSTPWLGTKWNDTEYERQAVTDDFQAIIRFQQEKNIPVHVGEFGAYSKADMDSRIRWTRYLSRWFEQNGFSWAYWEFNSGFGIYDPASGQYRTGLLNALTTEAMTNPVPVTLIDLYSSNFSSSPDGWNLYNNDASAASAVSIVSNRAQVAISSPGNQNWHIQLIRPGIAIQSGKSYRIVFNAYSTGSRSLSASLMLNASPWSLYGYADFSISATDKSYSFVFTAGATDPGAAFVFSMGNGGVLPVTLYNIKFQEVQL